MAEQGIYSIGYGRRTMEQFLGAMTPYTIAYIVDVRSQPYSRFNPDFSRERLQCLLHVHQIRYIYMGDTLGGRPKDGNCYTDGKVDYAKLSATPFYRSGVDRLAKAASENISVALMCSEARPLDCHRAKLIAESLWMRGIQVMHIAEDDALLPHTTVRQQLGLGQPTLFTDRPASLTSRRRYRSAIPVIADVVG